MHTIRAQHARATPLTTRARRDFGVMYSSYGGSGGLELPVIQFPARYDFIPS
jgi:hypothetical protein